jgi:lipid-binding SYLF domain-containing protein
MTIDEKRMAPYPLHRKWFGFMVLSALGAGCATPRGHGAAEKREFARTMMHETLHELHEREPKARTLLESSAGYGVFSNIGVSSLIFGGANGYGIIVDSQTGAETFMRMVCGTAGLGLGIKDFRSVMIFRDQATLESFVTKGWEFGAESDAAAKLGDNGGALAGAASMSRPIEIYQFTKNGLFLRAALTGTKYWRDEKLNDG